MASSAVATAVGAGLLTPKIIFAASDSFKATSDATVSAASAAAKGTFKFKAPKIAENGAVVPVSVDATNLNDVTNISFLVQTNNTPLAGSFNFAGALGFVSTRIKMGKTSPVTAVVTSGGSVSAITSEIKVTVGGCGG